MRSGLHAQVLHDYVDLYKSYLEANPSYLRTLGTIFSSVLLWKNLPEEKLKIINQAHAAINKIENQELSASVSAEDLMPWITLIIELRTLAEEDRKNDLKDNGLLCKTLHAVADLVLLRLNKLREYQHKYTTDKNEEERQLKNIHSILNNKGHGITLSTAEHKKTILQLAYLSDVIAFYYAKEFHLINYLVPDEDTAELFDLIKQCNEPNEKIILDHDDVNYALPLRFHPQYAYWFYKAAFQAHKKRSFEDFENDSILHAQKFQQAKLLQKHAESEYSESVEQAKTHVHHETPQSTATPLSPSSSAKVWREDPVQAINKEIDTKLGSLSPQSPTSAKKLSVSIPNTPATLFRKSTPTDEADRASPQGQRSALEAKQDYFPLSPSA